MLRNILGGLIFLSVLYLSALLGSIVLMGATLPFLWLRPSLFRSVNDRVITWWLYLPSAFLEILFGVKIIVTGDKLPKNETAVIIMNHRCRLDWMFYWSVMARYGELKHEKIIMKSELKNIPGPGWAMQNALHIFLKRRWEEDESYLSTVLGYFVDVLYPLQLLIFPEGTNFDDTSKSKSDSFAKKNGLPCYEYVLHPRVRGFTFCVEKLRQGRLDAVHDVTVGYSENYCFQELDLLKGKVPDEIHFHIQRYPNEELPKDTQGLEEWCANRWEEKEHRLRKFYNQEKHFISHPELASDKLDEVEVAVRYLMKKDLIFWAAFGCSFSILIYLSVWFRWYTVCMAALFTVLSFCGGTDKLFLQTQKPMSFKSD